jgi:hypothetical protein
MKDGAEGASEGGRSGGVFGVGEESREWGTKYVASGETDDLW